MILEYTRTSWYELEDAAKSGVVGLDGVGVQLEDKVGRRRVVARCDHRQTAAQLVVPDTSLVHLRPLQVQVEPQPISASVTQHSGRGF